MLHKNIRRMLSESLIAVLKSGKLPVELYPYQKETIEAVIRWLLDLKASKRSYISQATGLGKTVEFATLVQAAWNLRVLVVVPTKAIVEQTVLRLEEFTEGSLAYASSISNITRDGEVIARHWKSKVHDVVVATDETFKSSFATIKRELDPHLIICDECHWVYSDKAQSALSAFPESVIIVFSSTPDFLTTVAKADYIPVTLDNGQVLYAPEDRLARTHFGTCLDERNVRWGIENGWLAPLAWGQIEFKLSLEDVPVIPTPAGMDYDQVELQRVLSKNWDMVVKTIVKLYRSKQY